MSEPTAAVSTTTDNASVAEDFVDIFTSPSKVYARRAKASPMVPFLVVCVVMIALFFSSKNVLAPIFEAKMQQGIAQSMKANPQITPEMMEKSKPITNVVINVFGVIGVPVLLLFTSLILWIIGRFFMSSSLTYGTALLILCYSWFPRILGGVLGIVQGLVMDVSKFTEPGQVGAGIARFIDPASMSVGLYTLLSQIDLFTIWSTVLVVIGLMYAGKLDKSKATVAGVIMFVCGCIPSLFQIAKGQ
jgi:hypothetical protein